MSNINFNIIPDNRLYDLKYTNPKFIKSTQGHNDATYLLNKHNNIIGFEHDGKYVLIDSLFTKHQRYTREEIDNAIDNYVDDLKIKAKQEKEFRSMPKSTDILHKLKSMAKDVIKFNKKLRTKKYTKTEQNTLSSNDKDTLSSETYNTEDATRSTSNLKNTRVVNKSTDDEIIDPEVLRNMPKFKYSKKYLLQNTIKNPSLSTIEEEPHIPESKKSILEKKEATILSKLQDTNKILKKINKQKRKLLEDSLKVKSDEDKAFYKQEIGESDELKRETEKQIKTLEQMLKDVQEDIASENA